MISRTAKSSFAKYLSVTTGLSIIAMVAPVMALAQSTPTAAPKADDTVIIVTGVRGSQQSSIDRKKKAKTATDSITSEDVGSFPDKNIGEAISRIAGVALGRNDFGEGQDVTVRGASAEQTHVEIDGMSQLSTNGGISSGAGTSTAARGADFRELPADLVKSVDIVKGSLPSMTEGSLGGSIKIVSRNGLDFKKPYFSFRYDQTYNSLGQKWTPEWNMVASRKFMGNRLGVLFNTTYSEIQSNADRMQPGRNGTAGYERTVDLDQSPNKTFTYNPSVVDPGTAGNVQVFSPTGALVYQSLSPIDIVTRAAAAKTKQDCLAAFAPLTTAQLAAINYTGNGSTSVSGAVNNGRSASAARTDAQGEQTNELASCLNQWNDYTPSLPRTLPSEQNERRLAMKLRFDYKVNNDLTLYVDANLANRNQSSTDGGFNALNQASGQPFTANGTGFSTQGAIPADSNGLLTPRTTNAGFNFYSNGLCPTTIVGGLVTGCGTATDITSATVDASHHVTAMTISDGAVQVNGSFNHDARTSWYVTTGGTYSHGPVKLDFLAGTSGATRQVGNIGMGLTYFTGPLSTHVTPSGLWSADLATNLDFYNPNNYIRLNPAAAQAAVVATSTRAAVPTAYTTATTALYGTPLSFTWRPTMSNSKETQIKWDLTYNFTDKVPFVQDVLVGFQTRTAIANGWNGGGAGATNGTGLVGATNYVAPNLVPTNNLTTPVRVCALQTTSTQSCQYGQVTGSLAGTTVVADSGTTGSVITLSPTDYANLLQPALYERPTDFLADYPDKAGVTLRFPYVRAKKILEALGPLAGYNFDCMKVCKSPDGVLREQPHYASREQTTALYYQVDFEQELPFGMLFNGNFGTRYVKTIAQGTGNMTFTHISKTATFDPLNPGLAGGTVSSSISLNTSINSVTTDWTPSYNLALWVIPNKVVARYYTGHVIARPSVGQMLPSGTCIISDVTLGTIDSSGNDVDQQCTGRVGNPGLKPFKAINHNESIEWYVNKDTMVSLAYYYNNVYIGAPQPTTFTQSDLFSGTTFTDPVTGIPLSSTSFTYPTYINGPAGIQRGVEFSTKLAFTYLPWFFRYTGTDFNYSQLGSKNSIAARDLITGEALPPQFQASYFENWSIWYDDGRLSGRFSYQGRGTTFTGIAPCSNFFNNFPTSFVQNCGSTIRTPYNPGSANFSGKTQYFDAKINYKISKTVEVFFDGRNVLHGAATTTQPSQNFSDGTPTLNNFTYGGTRYTVGFTYRH